MFPSRYPIFLLLNLCISLLVVPLDAFVVLVPRGDSLLSTNARRNVILNAKKKKRRRKNAPPSSKSLDPVPADDLPDFDLNDDASSDDEVATPESPKTVAASTVSADEISPNMMGSTNKPVRSITELVADRSLEQKLQFDEDGSNQDLPDLLQMSRQETQNAAPAGSKRARTEARRTAAQARDQVAKEEGENPLSKLPFVTGEDGNIKPNKVLEAGAWLGIFLLIAWELYINSPFFERVAPMAPVVY